jgi:hypothetical protein
MTAFQFADDDLPSLKDLRYIATNSIASECVDASNSIAAPAEFYCSKRVADAENGDRNDDFWRDVV